MQFYDNSENSDLVHAVLINSFRYNKIFADAADSLMPQANIQENRMDTYDVILQNVSLKTLKLVPEMNSLNNFELTFN